MCVYDIRTTVDNIFALLQEKHITANELADALGVTPQAVSKWKHGKTGPSIDTLIMIADYCGVTLDELIARKEI